MRTSQAALLKRSSRSATSGFSIKKLISSKFSSKPKEHKCEKPSKEEMAKATPEQAFDKLWDHIICEADTNGDGKLSMEEIESKAEKEGQKIPEAMKASFKKHAGSDGKMDKAEFKRMLEAMMHKQKEAMQEKHEKKQAKAKRIQECSTKKDLYERYLCMADSNGDGKVKVSEIVDLFSKSGKPLSKEASQLKKHAGNDGLVDKHELKGFLTKPPHPVQLLELAQKINIKLRFQKLIKNCAQIKSEP